MLHLPAAARPATPWKNGGGVTREVARDSQSQGVEGFRWRVSIAEVAQEGAFSRFPNYRRSIAVIHGRGMVLEVTGREPTLLKPYEPYEFDGDIAVHGRLPFGPVSDLNVIFQPAAVRASLRFSDRAAQWWPVQDSSVVLINLRTEAVSCMAGDRSIELAYLDAVLASAGATVEMPGGSQYAVIEIVPAAIIS